MSKSTGNVVNPFFAIDRFGVDAMRFFLAYQGGLAGDADYDNAYIIRDYKKMLQWGIGNLAHRAIGCAKGNLRSFIIDAASDKLPSATPQDLEHQLLLEQTPAKVAEQMASLNPRAALQDVMSIIEKTNKYFHAAEPWKTPTESQRVLYNVAESLRISAILLQPFMPSKSQELLDILRVDNTDPSKRRFVAATFGSDPDYGEGVKKSVLFPPLIIEE
ncbi:hypothetical protein AWENTII_004161 [Aspergillus wentii]